MERCASFECVVRCRLVIDPVSQSPVSVPVYSIVRRAAVLGVHVESGCGGENEHLLAAKDETLLDGRDALLLLHLLLDLRDLVVALDVELNLLAGECSDPVHKNKS
jgi:hypothetical protein